MRAVMRIGEVREKAGLTKVQLADKLGVDISTVCKWESGPNRPKADEILRLAELFGCSIDELFDREASVRDSA